MTAISRMGFIKSKHDMHHATLAFFNRHSRQRSSPHWEASTLMLGSLARHLKEPQLVEHLHTALQDKQRDTHSTTHQAGKHFFETRTLMSALGNSGHAGTALTMPL